MPLEECAFYSAGKTWVLSRTARETVLSGLRTLSGEGTGCRQSRLKDAQLGHPSVWGG